MKCAVKVDGKYFAPFGGRNLLRLLTDIDAGIVYENVKTAKSLDCGLHHRCTGIQVPDIECKSRGRGTAIAKLRRRVLGFCNIAAADHYAGTGLRETARHAKADSAIAASNDGDLALEIE